MTKEQIIEVVGSRSGLMGLELKGLVKESASCNAGMSLMFYESVKRGRSVKKGKLVCVVCSEAVFNSFINVEDTDEVTHLDNGLVVIMEVS